MDSFSIENADDIIILGENTPYTPMKWRFPNTNNCPKVYCNRWFENRYAARLHYCKEHAKNDLLCVECNTLISMTGQQNMVNHYQRKHPNTSIPMPNASASVECADTAPDSTEVPICGDQMDESNEQTTQHSAKQSDLQPIDKQKKGYNRRAALLFTRRSNRNEKKNKSIKFIDVSIKIFPSFSFATGLKLHFLFC